MQPATWHDFPIPPVRNPLVRVLVCPACRGHFGTTHQAGSWVQCRQCGFEFAALAVDARCVHGAPKCPTGPKLPQPLALASIVAGIVASFFLFVSSAVAKDWWTGLENSERARFLLAQKLGEAPDFPGQAMMFAGFAVSLLAVVLAGVTWFRKPRVTGWCVAATVVSLIPAWSWAKYAARDWLLP